MLKDAESVKIRNALGFIDSSNPLQTQLSGINPATEGKQDILIAGQTPLSTILTTTVTLTLINTPYLLPIVEQISRRTIIVYNISDTDIYIGDSTVTTVNGLLLVSGGSIAIDISTGLYAVCSIAGKTVNVTELK